MKYLHCNQIILSREINENWSEQIEDHPDHNTKCIPAEYMYTNSWEEGPYTKGLYNHTCSTRTFLGIVDTHPVVGKHSRTLP